MHKILSEIFLNKLVEIPRYSSYHLMLSTKNNCSTISIEPFKDVNYQMNFRFYNDELQFLNHRINYSDPKFTFESMCNLVDKYAKYT